MQTRIGAAFADVSAVRIRAALFAALVLTIDVLLVAYGRSLHAMEARWTLVAVTLIVLPLLVQGDAASLGIAAKPIQGWKYWCRMSVVIALAVLAILAVSAGLWMLTGREIPVHLTPPELFGTRFVGMCLLAPLQEEILYRMVLCVSFVNLLRPSGTILLSGVLFGALHVVYGNPSPENLFGGLFLAWGFLKSGTILVPILLHGLGNSVVLLGQVGGWYLFQ